MQDRIRVNAEMARQRAHKLAARLCPGDPVSVEYQSPGRHIAYWGPMPFDPLRSRVKLAEATSWRALAETLERAVRTTEGGL